MSDDPTTSHPTLPAGPTDQRAAAAGRPGGPDVARRRRPTAPAPAGPVLEPVRPVPVHRPSARGSSGRWLNVLLGVAVAVAIGGVAFAVGRSTAPAQAATFQRGAGFRQRQLRVPRRAASTRTRRRNGATGRGGAGRFGLGGGGVTINGTVDSVSADSITITTASGQQVTLSLSGDTAYHTQTPATAVRRDDRQQGGRPGPA